ncbi:MAG: hypothetical protein LBL24_09835 [Bacteroidales bacterium]|nr:hypothetical protein [Bacteroidales bacterium]
MNKQFFIIYIVIQLNGVFSFAQENISIADTVTKADSQDFVINCMCPSSSSYRTSPLFLIDGLEVSADVFARLNLNPDDIQTFTITDAKEALELYGTRGVNGVAIISTKLSQKDLKKRIKEIEKETKK